MVVMILIAILDLKVFWKLVDILLPEKWTWNHFQSLSLNKHLSPQTAITDAINK